MERLLGNAGWWCACIQSHESSGCPLATKEHQRQESGLERHPTGFTCQHNSMGHEMRHKTYSLHPESTTLIHHLEEILVFLAAEPRQAGDLKVGPEMAHVVLLALHCLRINIWQVVFSIEKLPWNWWAVVWIVLWLGLWLVWLRLNEHLPQALGCNVVDALICGCVTPDIWHGFLEFLDGNGKTIGLVGSNHLLERIVGNVAEVLDLWLKTPVPIVTGKKLMLIEESERAPVSYALSQHILRNIPRVKSAHGVIRLHATVHNSSITLLGNALLRDSWIYPVWETPHAGIDLSELNGSAGVIHDGLLEVVVEVAVVQEDVRVMVPSVEVTLNGLNGLEDTVELLVSGQHNEGCVCLWFRAIWDCAAGHEDLIVLLADFP